MNLTGIAQALLYNISILAGLNDPQLMVSPVGFLKMLLENPASTTIKNIADLRAGQDKEIKVRYMQRGVEGDVTDEDNCDTPTSGSWNEATIGRPYFSKIGIYISDEDMRSYEVEATQTLTAGNPGAPLMRALYETILAKTNGIIQHIDRTLVTAQSAKFGVNAATGSNIASAIAFGTTPSMENGIVKLSLDATANELNGPLLVCGNGVVTAFDALNKLKMGVDAQGFGAADFRAYNDPKTVASWGLNHFGVFASGLVGFVDFNKNVGSYAGLKGGSYFFTIPIPAQLANGELTALTLDAQLKYEDCPIYEAGEKVADRGWKLILSKSYGLFNAPNDMFAVGDPLRGMNGSLHYLASKEERVYQTQEVAQMINITGITTNEAAKALATTTATYDFASHLTVAPADATARHQIIYASATPAKATVSQLGIVTGVAAGTSVITATTLDGGFVASVTVTVP